MKQHWSAEKTSKTCGSGSGVEHRLAKARVASSNLVFRSKGCPRTISKRRFSGIFQYFQAFYEKAGVIDDRKFLLIGFDNNSNLLEVMYNITNENIGNVFHAMRCRKQFMELVER